MKDLKHTGRTTRMLEEAKRLASLGRAVYVVAADEAHAAILKAALPPKAETGISVETPESLGNFDWHYMRLMRAHPNCVVLVDHYTIESRFALMLNMLHRFDADAGTPPPEPFPPPYNDEPFSGRPVTFG